MNVDLNPYLGATKAELKAEAATQGCNLILPTPFELFLDIDLPYKNVHKRLWSIQDGKIWTIASIIQKEWDISFESQHVTQSVSGNTHIYLKVDTDLEEEDGQQPKRFLIQSLLGSDPVREVLGYGIDISNVLHASTNLVSCCFFETLSASIGVEAWRILYPKNVTL